MAGTDGEKTPALRLSLVHQGFRFSFIQIYRLLSLLIRREERGQGEGEKIARRIHIRPDLSLQFPENEVVSVAEGEEPPESYRVVAAFLGLYGASSPLPAFYTEDLLRESAEDRSITRDFIDVINNALYHLFFQCWAKNRLAYQVAEEGSPEALDRIYCLLGLGSEEIKASFDHPYGLLRFIGLASQSSRSAEGLRSLLSDALNTSDLQVEEGLSRSVPIPDDQRFKLGIQGNLLGISSYLGKEIKSCTGKFRIHLGPLPEKDFRKFLPDQPSFARMGELVRFYVDQPGTWDVEIKVAAETVKPACLGGIEGARLGWNSWVCSRRLPSRYSRVRLQQPPS
jgi:type VI secretion system protein ImpH